MSWLRNVPIQRKLRFVILATCTAALCVACSALFAVQYYSFERDYRKDLESVAEMIAYSSAKVIALNAPEQTQDFLDALEVKPHVTGAMIRLSDGSVASEFGHVEGWKGQTDLAGDGFLKRRGELIYIHPIVDGHTRQGSLIFFTDYGSQSMKLHGFQAGLLLGVLAISFLVAVLVSSRLERVICGPIQALVDTARRITSRNDYALRAVRAADDEIGEFTDSFNSMLDRIQQREAALRHEIVERVRAEEELQRVHRQLVDASRAAGMAEVATGVLHNVGNVLNSVNVSAILIAEKLGSSRTGNLLRATELLQKQNGHLAEFLNDDPKGRVLPGYLVEVSEHVVLENAEARTELESLTKNIEHIKDIVAMQQSYARVSGFIESLPVEELAEDALRMNTVAFTRHRITVFRDYEPVPMVSVDKHKVLQILINLLRNAKYAMDEAGDGDRQLTVRIRKWDENAVAIEVGDTGVGIPVENLTRIFSHGFTTREDGHGFGLHSAAIAAQQMGGWLGAASPGPGQGSTFTLALPVTGRPMAAVDPAPEPAGLVTSPAA